MDALAKAKRSSKEVIALAKQWLAEQYADEDIKDIGLEEVRFENDVGSITLGFQRKREIPTLNFMQTLTIPQAANYEKALKVLALSDKTREILSMRDRITE